MSTRSTEPDYEAVRRYVETHREQARSRQRRKLWRLHFLLYLTVNLISWTIIDSPNATQLALGVMGLITVTWGIGLFLHARMLYLESPKGLRQLEARLAMQAMEQLAANETAKPKREQIMRLSDDGELVPDAAYDVELEYRARSGS